MGEATEARPIEIDSQGVVGGDQDVDAHVELLVANEQGVVDVALHNVGFGLVGGVCPVADVVEGTEQEDALALAAADLARIKKYGFHNPDGLLLFVAFELLDEDWVLAGHVIGEGEVVVPTGFLCLPLPLQCLFVALYVFREEVLAGDLIEIAEMVDAFVGEKTDLVEGFGDKLFLAPVDVPVIVFGLPVLPPQQ